MSLSYNKNKNKKATVGPPLQQDGYCITVLNSFYNTVYLVPARVPTSRLTKREPKPKSHKTATATVQLYSTTLIYL